MLAASTRQPPPSSTEVELLPEAGLVTVAVTTGAAVRALEGSADLAYALGVVLDQPPERLERDASAGLVGEQPIRVLGPPVLERKRVRVEDRLRIAQPPGAPAAER